MDQAMKLFKVKLVLLMERYDIYAHVLSFCSKLSHFDTAPYGQYQNGRENM